MFAKFFKKKQKTLYVFDGKTAHDRAFGEGSWDALERRVVDRLQKNDPYLYHIIKSFEDE